MKIVVAVTGASGVIVGKRLIEELKKENEVKVIVSETGKKTAECEGVEIVGDYSERDIDADIASSSNKVDALVVCPCSMKTLAAIANGYADNLIARLADVQLKMGRKVIVCPRETPYNLIHVENMRKIILAGGKVCPLNVAYYFRPESVEDVTDFFVGKIMELLGLEHKLYKRWGK